MKRYMVAAAVACLLLALPACMRDSDSLARGEERIRASIMRMVESDSASYPIIGDDAFREQVEAFYSRRDFRPAWVSADGSTQRLRDILNMFCNADREGLSPSEYANVELDRRIRRAYADVDSLHTRALAELDLTVTHTLMDYAHDVLDGRVDPQALETAWNTPTSDLDVLDALTDTTGEASLQHLAQNVSERRPEYAHLREALAQYRAIAERGGWPTISAGEALSEDDEGPRVAALIERLAASGDVDSSLIPTHPDSARYTPNVASGVERFQRRHGIRTDGIAGEVVFKHMNVPVDERIRQIELNMERWRWLPAHLGRRYVHVNVPAYELHAFRDGQEVLSMAVVVGEQYDDNDTPVFSDTMEYVEFNPYWNVPASIASEEIVPKAREDRDYLVRNDYEIVAGWETDAPVIDPASADLDLVENKTYRIRQKPGVQNALGRIKFMFPNEFDIYLHDTPEEHLFDRSERAYSHGCIRLEHPVEFGEFALGSEEWPADRIRQRIESGERTTQYLDSPLPVYILYWTAFVDKDGLVNFRDDIYGSDEELDEALQSQISETEPVPCGSLIAGLDD